MSNEQNDIERLAQDYIDIQIEEIKLKEKKDRLESTMLEMIDESEMRSKGVVHLNGGTKKISVTFVENTSYPDKEKLWDLYEQLGEKADKFFTPSLRAKNSAIDEFVSALESVEEENDTSNLLKQAQELRKVSKGKTRFQVKDT